MATGYSNLGRNRVQAGPLEEPTKKTGQGRSKSSKQYMKHDRLITTTENLQAENNVIKPLGMQLRSRREINVNLKEKEEALKDAKRRGNQKKTV